MNYRKARTAFVLIANIVVAILAGFYVMPAIDFWNSCHTTRPAFIRFGSAQMNAILVPPIICAAVFLASLCAVVFSLLALSAKSDHKLQICTLGTVTVTSYTILILMTVISFAIGGYTPGVQFLLGCVVQ